MTALPVQAPQAPTDVALALEERIRYARSEDDLDALVEHVQGGFEAGELTQAQAERLAYLVIGIARQLEQGLVNVPITMQPEGERDGC